MLEQAGFSVEGYYLQGTSNDTPYRVPPETPTTDPYAVTDEFSERNPESASGEIVIDEPLDQYGDLLFHTMILYHDDGFFTVEYRRAPEGGTFDDADRWIAQIERALLDADLPVMLGNRYHKDNEPTTDFYGE